MKTTTKDITLCMELNEDVHSPECTSTLIDLWAGLQLTAVEPTQAPLPNLFAFAESCLFFAVIMEDHKPEDWFDGDKPDEQMREHNQGSETMIREAYPRSTSGMLSSNAPGASHPFPGFVAAQTTAAVPTSQNNISQECEYQNLNYIGVDNSRTTDNNYLDDDQMTLFDDPNPVLTDLPSIPRPFTNTGTPYNYDGSTDPWQSYTGLGYSTPTIPFATTRNRRAVPLQVPPKAIGIVYVMSSPQEYAPVGAANIGIILKPDARGKGFAKQAVGLVLSWLFDDIGLHRVQAGVLDSADKDWVITLFTQM